MSKTAPQIEAEIRAALNKVRGPARGLYHEMRYVAQNLCNGRPGELQQDSSPLALETIAQLCGYSPAKVPQLLTTLQSPDVALVARHGDGGPWCLPHLRRIDAAMSRNREKVARCRGKSRKGPSPAPEGLRNPQEGVTSGCCNQGVTVLVPPDGSPPHPPSLSPSASSLGEALENAFNSAGIVDSDAGGPRPDPSLASVGDDLDRQIRTLYRTSDWLGVWERKSHEKFRQLAVLTGWESAVDLVRQGVAAGKGFPVGWALSKARSLKSETGGPRRGPSGVASGPGRSATTLPNLTIRGEV